MAWMICGTVPDASFPLTGGRWRLDGGFLHAEGGGIAPLSVQRGTPALLGTALLTCETLGVEPPTALLAGDTGNGDGSRKLYSRLAASPSLSGVRGITFHYLFPDLDGHNRVLMALEEAGPKPVLVADAGFMYVAKICSPPMPGNWPSLPMKRRRTLFTPGGSCWPRMRISQASSNAPISTETPRASCSSKGRSITLWKAGGSSATYPNRRLPLWSPSEARAISSPAL